MRYVLTLMAMAAVASTVVPLQAQAQPRHGQPALGGGLPIRVTPRSFLDPGVVVPVGSINPGYTGYGQTQSYLASPPYAPAGAGFGTANLPDPITNGPFVGSRNPFGPIDYRAPPGLAR